MLQRLTNIRLGAVILLGILAAAVFVAAEPGRWSVLIGKWCGLLLAGHAGYFLDCRIFPYARPDGYLQGPWRGNDGQEIGQADHPVVVGYEWVFAAAMLRRALVVGATIVAWALAVL